MPCPGRRAAMDGRPPVPLFFFPFSPGSREEDREKEDRQRRATRTAQLGTRPRPVRSRYAGWGGRRRGVGKKSNKKGKKKKRRNEYLGLISCRPAVVHCRAYSRGLLLPPLRGKKKKKKPVCVCGSYSRWKNGSSYILLSSGLTCWCFMQLHAMHKRGNEMRGKCARAYGRRHRRHFFLAGEPQRTNGRKKKKKKKRRK